MPDNNNISHLDELLRAQQRRRRWRRWWRWALRVGYVLGFLLLVLYLVVRSERFQQYAIGLVKTALEERMDTRVEIGYFRFGLIDKVLLDDFYVETPTGDTLLYTQRLKANLNTNIFNLLNKKFIIEDIWLQHANIRLQRDTAAFKHDIELLLDKLLQPAPLRQDTDEPNTPFAIELANVYLRDVRFFKRDLMRGEDMTVYVDYADVAVENLDLQHKNIAIGQADIYGIRMDLEQYARDEAFFEYWYNYAPPPDTTNTHHVPDAIPQTFVYTVREFNLCDGQFYFDDNRNEPVKDTPDNILDYQHLAIADIGGTIYDFKFENRVFSGELYTLALRENSGFQLNELAVDSVTVSPKGVELYDLSLTTEDSSLGDTLIFKYRTYEDFMNFSDRVRMDIRFNESTLAVYDLTTFVPKLKTVNFFKTNAKEKLYLNGRFTGKINNLSGKDLRMQLGKNIYMDGAFNSRNLAVRNEEFMLFELKNLQTTIPALKQLIPDLRLPPNFDKLGNIRFNGRFDGFFVDFVAYGNLQTALGNSRLDMQMQLDDRRTNANYSGSLELTDFDLARWMGDSRFGKVTFSSQVRNGRGLTSETVEAALSANIEKFPFQGYVYKNLIMEGALRRNYFNGDFSIKDDNIDLAFTGAIDFENPVAIYDFTAQVKKLDLQALKLSKKDYVLSGDIDLNMKGDRASNLEGYATMGHLELLHANDTFVVDTLSVFSTIDAAGEKYFSINSDLLDMKMEGVFSITKVPLVLRDFFAKKHPTFARKFNIPLSNPTAPPSYFEYLVEIKNSKNFTQLFAPKLDTLKEVVVQGNLSTLENRFKIDVEVPRLQFGQFDFADVIFLGEANEQEFFYDLGIYQTIHKDKNEFAPVNLLTNIVGDTLFFGLNAQKFAQSINDININGKFFVTPDDLFQVSFLPSNLLVQNQQWDISETNYLRFGNNLVYTKNFTLTNEDKIIKLETEGKSGLALQVDNFNLNFINDLWTYDKLDFDGIFSVRASVGDIFKLSDIKAAVQADQLDINGDNFGLLQLTAEMEDPESILEANFLISKGSQKLSGKGRYALPSPRQKVAFLNRKKLQANHFDAHIDIANYPLAMLEYFIPSGISETVGRFEADVHLYGTPQQPNIGGELRIFEAALNVDYLGTRYFIDGQKAKLTSTLFDGTGAIITDRFGNEARVFGGIAHDHFKDLRLAARLETDRFLALETDKEDNPTFYGTALGEGIITFEGPFRTANISAIATTGRDTKIVIPVSDESDGSAASFIDFLDKSMETNQDTSFELRGVNLDLNLTMTELAETQLVFDERAGDILKGFGNGNLRLAVSRTGDFKMFGNYQVAKGEYLFTYKVPNIDFTVINKLFSVKEGGTIKWNGDPFEAQINLEASYKGLTASPYNLIAEFVEALPNEQIQLEARKTTDVDLVMYLKGALGQPDINFDILFPNLQGEINNFISNKMRLLRQDPLELNRQVFGLIVIGGFLPSGEGAFANQGGVLINNTVSQVISNQLSIYLTDFISESLKEDGAISGVDFDVNYSEFLYDDFASLDDLRGSELSVRPRIYLLDDRLTVDIGVGIGLDNSNIVVQGATSRLNSSDIVFEFAISDDRRLKIRAYNRYEQTIAGQLNKTGVGLSYRREFDTFKEFFKGLKRKKKKRKGEE